MRYSSRPDEFERSDLLYSMMTRSREPSATAPLRILSVEMTLRDFDHGYWYAADLRVFATKLEIPFANKLRKDQLEAAIKNVLAGNRPGPDKTLAIARRETRDVDKGLHLDLPVVRYTSNKETKLFIDREAANIQPGFKRASGTRYLLNRWREEQVAAGREITYRDLVLQAIALNHSKRGPLRIEHGRYLNFISDYMTNNRGASHHDAVQAWHEVKAMDTPKTYAAWARMVQRDPNR